jgi:hypothetical protein
MRNQSVAGDQVKKPTQKPRQSGTRKKSKTPPTARGRKRSPANGHKTPAGRGAARLRDSINAMVSKQSDRIAQALIDKTVKGNMTGARILVELSGADKAPPVKKKRRGLSWAQRLANEPEWDPSMVKSVSSDGAITVLMDGTIKRDASKLPPSDYDLPDDLK